MFPPTASHPEELGAGGGAAGKGEAEGGRPRLTHTLPCLSARASEGGMAEQQGQPNRILSLRPRYLWAVLLTYQMLSHAFLN